MAWHARKSASGSKRWIKCAGSLALVDAMDPSLRRPTGAAAMTGTCAHGLGEYLLRSGHREVPDRLLNTIVWLDAQEDAHLLELEEPQIETVAQLSAELGVDVKFFARIDEKMRDGVQLYLDVVWQDHDEMGPTVEMMVEERFDMEWLRPGLGGTSDCTLWQYLGLLRVIDYKNGYVNVEAEDNTQGLKYALGMAHVVEWAFDDVEVVIVQPNTRQGSPVKRFRVTREQLEAFRDMLAEASDRVDEAGEALGLCQDQADFADWASTYLDAGTDDDHDHCTFCDAFATCPAAQALAQDVAQADFADDPPDLNPVEAVDQDGLERLCRTIKWAGYLDAYVKAAKTLGQRRLEQGLEVPGQKLVEGKANRRFESEKDVVTLFVAKGFAQDELYEPPKPPTLKSPAQMEKLGAPRSKERKLAKELVGGLASKPPGKLAMAPIDDPREAVEPRDAASDFVDDMPHDYEDEA